MRRLSRSGRENNVELLASLSPGPQVVREAHWLRITRSPVKNASGDAALPVPDDLDQARPLKSGHALLTDPIAKLAVCRVERDSVLHLETPVASRMRDGVL
jgi:hypothetical protein